MQQCDLIIKNGICLTPMGRIETNIAVKDGKIIGFGDSNAMSAKQIFDAKHFHILPGVIDTQVHFREPGLTHKEDIHSGAKAAAMGGVTGFFEMPNTNPATLDEASFQYKIARASSSDASSGSVVDFAFFIGGAAENIGQLKTLEKLSGAAGIKIFMGSSTGSLLVEEEEILRNILLNSTAPISIHAEDEARLKQRFHIAETTAHPKAHPIWRDSECALLATKRIIRLANETKRQVHVLHISSADELPLLQANKAYVSAEVTPQHLTLTAPECYDDLGTLAQMNPPIRDKSHQEKLWQAVCDGVFDILGSDHAPHLRSEKEKPYPQSPSGMAGVQTLVPVMLTHVNHGKLSLERFVDLTASGPQRIFRIQNKGRIALGYDADFTIIDLQKKYQIKHEQMVSKTGWTPFDGFQAQGKPVATIVRGNIVMREDTLLQDNGGQPIRFMR
ncbi:MAG: dihydroorotase [Alphaproteobacteria bacterium]|nr:dihydroorotase [Alphaproteobacteria bacterium]